MATEYPRYVLVSGAGRMWCGQFVSERVLGGTIWVSMDRAFEYTAEVREVRVGQQQCVKGGLPIALLVSSEKIEVRADAIVEVDATEWSELHKKAEGHRAGIRMADRGYVLPSASEVKAAAS